MLCVTTTDHKYQIYDGKKTQIKKKLPDAKEVLTDNLSRQDINTLMASGVIVKKCSVKTLDAFAKNQCIADRGKAMSEMAVAMPAAFFTVTSEPKISALYYTFKNYQKSRVAASNRFLSDQSKQVEELLERMIEFENELRDQIETELKKIPIYAEWLLKIKGVGPSMAGGLCAYLGDCSQFTTVSDLWSFSGYGVNSDGQIQKKTKGQKANWNHHIKSHMYNLVGQLMKANCPLYADIYREEKEKQEPKVGKGHAHARAMRKVAKLFLSHYFYVSKILSGKKPEEIPKPWILAVGGHAHYIAPPFFDPQTI